MSVESGDVFMTGNETINQMKPGTLMEYLGSGEVSVLGIPQPANQPKIGDDVEDSKGRKGIRVRLSAHLSVEGLDPNQGLMVDEDYVVRKFDL